MKKENAIRYYRKFSAADAYIVGFVYKKEVYVATVKELMPRWIRVEHEASSKGGKEKLQLRLRNEHKEQLIRKGATKVDYKVVKGKNGRAFEKWVYEQAGKADEYRGDGDHIGFWVEGDINIDGIEYQVKFEGAQIVVFETLKNLQACGKDFRNYVQKGGRKATKPKKKTMYEIIAEL